MIIAALVTSVASILVNVWAINQRRMLNEWTRSGFAGPMPTWRQVRWYPTAPPLYQKP